MDAMHLRALRSSVFGTLALGALIFGPAGTLDYWQGWAYLIVLVATSGALNVYLAFYNPELLRRRMRAGPAQEQEAAQRIIMLFAMLCFLLLIIVPGLDRRFGWSHAPWWIALAGNELVALGFAFFFRVVQVNSFAAGTVRVEEGQKVASTGPYAWVRHPMYAGALILLVGTPLALGSWWGLLVVPVFVPVIVLRILNEEAVLARDLQGYTAYQREARWRLIPLVW
jgi:protein-S-isoprenylcysteine O-methyltransferase Ste14